MEGDCFPVGLKVFVVDDDLAYLDILESLLIECKYEVTSTTEGVKALEMLRENKNKFDIVISDVHMPSMDGFKLLELISLELDIPVIMLSGNDNPDLVMKGVQHGAVDYLVKPVRLEELKNIWQHVVRKNMCKEEGQVNLGFGAGKCASFPLSIDGHANTNLDEERPEEQKVTREDEYGEYEAGEEDSYTQKKARVVWSAELHQKFIDAITELGPENVFPKKIMDIMNVEGLTRDNVASHLQKYRLFLQKTSSLPNQPTEATTAVYNTQNSFTYGNGVPLSNSFGMYCSSRNQIDGMSLTTSDNQTLATTVKPKVGVPCLQDYSKTKMWMKSSNPQQNVVHVNQHRSSSFNNMPYVHNAVERPIDQVSTTPGYYFTPKNDGCKIVDSTPCNIDNLEITNIGSSNQSVEYNSLIDFATREMNVVGTSSFVQKSEVPVNEVDAPRKLDDNHMREPPIWLEDHVDDFIKGPDDLSRGAQ